MNNEQMVVAFLMLFVIGESQGGDVVGRVSVSGSAPKMSVINMQVDPACVRINEVPVISQEVDINEFSGLRNVVVFIENVPGFKVNPPSERVVLQQLNCMFVPHVLAFQSGQPLVLRNSDPTLHNQHLNAKNNKMFNMALPMQDMETEKILRYPEIMKINCDVHRWEHAYIAVFDHPYFSVTDSNGSFHIQELPAGRYVIKAWHEYYGEEEKEIYVSDSEQATTDFYFK